MLLLLKHTRKLLVRSLLSRDQALARWRQSKFILAANDWVRRGDLGGCAICSVGFKSYDPAIFLVILHSNQYLWYFWGSFWGGEKILAPSIFIRGDRPHRLLRVRHLCDQQQPVWWWRHSEIEITNVFVYRCNTLTRKFLVSIKCESEVISISLSLFLRYCFMALYKLCYLHRFRSCCITCACFSHSSVTGVLTDRYT